MPDDDIAHAVSDETDRLHTVEVLNDAVERVGVSTDFAHGRRIANVDHAKSAFFLKIVGQAIHPLPTCAQTVHDDHDFLRHRGKILFYFDSLQFFQAVFETTARMSTIVRVDQPVMTNDRVLLNSPILIDNLVGESKPSSKRASTQT